MVVVQIMLERIILSGQLYSRLNASLGKKTRYVLVGVSDYRAKGLNLGKERK